MKVLRLVLSLVLFATGLAALDVTTLKPEGHVSDFARILDAGTKSKIENYLRRVKEATKAEIAIVTIQQLDDEPIADVANTLYRQWGIGGKETNEGVLFLISMQERRTRLEVGYGLEPIIPDGYLGGILRQIRPQMRERNYGAALTEVAQILGQRVAQAKGVTIPEILTRRRSEPSGLPWPMIIFGIVMLMFFLMGGSGGRGGRGMGLPFPIFLPGGFGGGRGHSSGGGFGGYDSGGSFGGFGGGDSGGGGASGDW